MKIIKFDCLESTNVTAKEYAIEGAKHGTVIMAEQQTGGKGQHGRSFFSPPGHGIYMSIILHDSKWRFSFENPTLITAHAAVSVCQAIEAAGIIGKTPQIKPVNDILLNGRKICGILTESRNNLEWVVVGIGVNFTTPESGFPAEISDIAGTLFNSGGTPTLSKEQLATQIIERVLSIEAKNDKTVLAEYNKRLSVPGITPLNL